MEHPLYGVLPFPDLKSIRLLELDISMPEGPIRCTLSVHNINATPAYTALSYTWRFPYHIAFPDERDRDRPTPLTKILCNGKDVYIDNNLHAALHQLRAEKADYPIWADAICINQDDREEKSKHIPLMGEIYAGASKVIVWFGKQHPAFSYIKEAVNIILPFLQAKGEPWFVSRSVYHVDVTEVSTETFPKIVAEILKFVADARWFSRLWVVQEIALAKDSQARCGVLTVSWGELAALVTLFTNMGWFTEIHTKEDPWKPDELANGIVPTAFHNINLITDIINKADSWIADGNWRNAPDATQGSFVHRLDGFFGTRSAEEAIAAWTSYLLHSSAWFSCTVAEDYYYSSIGIAARLCQTDILLVQPNVGGPLIELFTSLTGKILLTSRSVGFLAVNGDLARKHHAGIPSWVPDFTSKIEKPNPISFNGLYLPGMFDASKSLVESRHPRRVDFTEGTITLTGARFDTISSVTASTAEELMNRDDTILELMDFLMRFPPQTSTGQNRVEALWRTLIFNVEVFFHDFERKYIYPAKPHCGLYFRAWLQEKLAAFLVSSTGDASPAQDVKKRRIAAFLEHLVRDGGSPSAIPSLAEIERFVQRSPQDAEWHGAVSTSAREMGRMAGRLVTQRRLFLTAERQVSGMCSLSPREGDEVWMVRDCAAPLVLRRVGVETAGGAEERYVLVGEAYVHGFMNGEMVDGGLGLVDGSVTLV